MNPIETILEPTNGYIRSFTRDTVNGWWEVEVGMPKTWVFSENKDISCILITENDVGKLIKISPKKSTIVFDDLINFVEIIIETNKRIANKEKEFTDKMEEMKNTLENEAKKFYNELDELKINSFKNLNQKLNPISEKTTRKPRQPKEAPIFKSSGVHIKEIDDVDQQNE